MTVIVPVLRALVIVQTRFSPSETFTCSGPALSSIELPPSQEIEES